MTNIDLALVFVQSGRGSRECCLSAVCVRRGSNLEEARGLLHQLIY